MRNTFRKLKALAIAGAAALFMGSAANAATVNFGSYAGTITITYGNFDVGRIYDLAPGANVNGVANVNALAQTHAGSPFTPVAGGGALPITGSTNASEDTWGIARVTAIYAGTSAFDPVIYQAGNPGFQGNLQLTAIFYGGQDIQASLTATTEIIRTSGVQLAIFASEVGNNADGLDLSATPTAAARGNGPISYPGITDGTLIFSFNGDPGHFADNPAAEQEANINLAILNGPPTQQAVGDGKLFLEKGAINFGSGLVTGVQNNYIVSSAGADAQVQFTTRQGQRDWTVTSNDPLVTDIVAVPNPTAVSGGLMLGAILGFNYLRRRKSY